MRTFLLLFVAAWVIGVVLGAVELTGVLLLVVIGLFTASLIQWHWSLPHITAAVGLLAAGFLWADISQLPAPDCTFTEKLTGSVARVHGLSGSAGQYVVADERGCAVLLTTSRFPEYNTGDRLEVSGTIQLVSDIPIEYAGYGEYLNRQGIAATVRYADAVVVESHSSSLAALGAAIRQRIERTFAEPEASIVTAMLLGQRGSIPEDIEEQFRRTGVSHVLAISGLHVSLLVGLVLIVLYQLPISGWWRTGLLLLLLWGYILLIDFPVSATRAGYFWTLAAVALQLRALVSLPTVLVATVIIMISAQPAIIFDVGFQLSVAAVTGIGLILFLAKRTPVQAPLRQNILASVAWVSLGATLTTWPIVAYHFGMVSFISVVANILIVPVVPIFLTIALVATLISFVSPLAGLLGSLLVHGIWQWIQAVAELLSRLPAAAIEDINFPAWSIPFYYFLLVVASATLLQRSGRTWREVWE